MASAPNDRAAGVAPRRLFFYNAGFLRQKRLRRILELSGHELRLGLPWKGDGVVVWGQSPYAARGAAVAKARGVTLLRVEDTFLRSVRPGRSGDAPLGLLIDPFGVHFDAEKPSLLEILLDQDLQDSNILDSALAGIERLKALDLSKYNIHLPDTSNPEPGYVLVVDQTFGDASVRGHEGRFQQMLAAALAENPDRQVLIKAHPETAMGFRSGHFGPEVQSARVRLWTAPSSPWRLLEGAVRVYTVSSQLGFEAILAGHRPRVFGQPFYAGWGLSDDEYPPPRRGQARSKEQLFAAAMIQAPRWYDPCRDRLCSFDEAVNQLEAEVRRYRDDARGHVALGMRMWKRGRLQAMFGGEKPLRFADEPAMALAEASARSADILVWAGKEPEELAATGVFDGKIRRVEDGLLRSRGLGAQLVPPLSLVTDDLGIYYDPTRESRLERLIAEGPPPGGLARAERLVAELLKAGLTKYNLAGGPLPDLPAGRRILVPGQVEDDASIKWGASAVRSNLALIEAARSANPRAVLLYKPHPDVEAGLRPGAIAPERLADLVDVVVEGADLGQLLPLIDEVWTMTSALGFEALLRGKRVVCLGMPFFAGWGLTTDLAPVPARRRAFCAAAKPPVSLAALAHAVLIAYPRYFDPVSRLPCPVEVAVDRLRGGDIPSPSLGHRGLAKLQGLFASYAGLWR